MAKNVLRSVNTKFWTDSFIEELNPKEKLLFLYLLTNPLTNMLGIYEVSIKRISYDTGLTDDEISKALKAFEMVKKVYYKENHIILPNFLKNQNLNANMKKGSIDIFNALSNTLKESIIGKGSKGLPKDSKGFESLLNTLGKYEREVESEREVEIESECEEENNFPHTSFKKTLSIRKDEFQSKLISLVGSESEKLNFLEYWTQENDHGFMRFEKDEFWHLDKKWGNWLKNVKTENNGNRKNNKGESRLHHESEETEYSDTF